MRKSAVERVLMSRSRQCTLTRVSADDVGELDSRLLISTRILYLSISLSLSISIYISISIYLSRAHSHTHTHTNTHPLTRSLTHYSTRGGFGVSSTAAAIAAAASAAAVRYSLANMPSALATATAVASEASPPASVRKARNLLSEQCHAHCVVTRRLRRLELCIAASLRVDDQLTAAGGALAEAQERRDAMSTLRGGVDGLAESFRRGLLEAGDLFDVEL